MKKLLLIPAVAGFLTALFPAAANAALYCPVRSSIFGTVSGVRSNELTLSSVPGEFGRMGYIHVISNGARVNANGLQLRRGVFAGVYGCLTPDRRQFNAEDVTLAPNEAAYESYPRRTVSLQGRVEAVRSGRFLMDSNGGHGDLWVYTNAPVRTGQLVGVTGSFAPRNASFEASSISVLQQ